MHYEWSKQENEWVESHPDIVAVDPRPGWTIWVKFADGTEGEHDLSDLSDCPGVFAPWKDRAFFESVYLDGGVPAWPGDIDIAPEPIWDDLSAHHKKSP